MTRPRAGRHALLLWLALSVGGCYARGSRDAGGGVERWITILHGNDGESELLYAGPGQEAIGGAGRFERVLARLRDEHAASARVSRQPHGILLVSSGDNFLAGPQFFVSLEKGPPFYDAMALSRMRFDVLALGNHDFDFGPDVLADFVESFRTIAPDDVPVFVSANLDFSNVPRLRAETERGTIATRAVVATGAGRVGVVGATTPDLPYLSCPAEVGVRRDVAAIVQEEVDALGAEGVDVIVLVGHLQDIQEDLALVAELRDVDVVVAGGGDELLANENDLLVPGDEGEGFGPYPIRARDRTGAIVPVVTTSGKYRYVGRLSIGVDGYGRVVEIDGSRSGPVRVVGTAVSASDGVEAKASLQREIVHPMLAALEAMETRVVGVAEVPLDGRRRFVRTRSTNLARVVGDALLWKARELARAEGRPLPRVALHNGGGIRNDSIIPPGDVTELDTFSIVPFPDFITVVAEVTPDRLLALLENGVSRVAGAAGRFPHGSGFAFTWDPEIPPGGRIREIILDDGTPIVTAGAVAPGAPPVALATTNFLCRGGDEYPFHDLAYVSLGVTLQQALRAYIEDALGGRIAADRYPAR